MFMSNGDLTPNAEFFDTKGRSYPAFIELIKKGDESYYSPNEICDAEGKPWHEGSQAYFCIDFYNQDPRVPTKQIPVVPVIVNYGRNESSGDEEHKNPQHWRNAGMHRHRDWVIQGRTAPTTCCFIHRTDWQFDESIGKWVKEERAVAVKARNEKMKAESEHKAKIEAQRIAAENAAILEAKIKAEAESEARKAVLIAEMVAKTLKK